MKKMERLVEILHEGNHSLAIYTPISRSESGSEAEVDAGECISASIHIFDGRGISDLYRIYTSTPAILKNAMIADKVVGKGAAALMILGGVSKLHADVISKSALSLLQEAGVQVEYAKLADNIINKQNTGICPIETLCLEATSAEECLPKIEFFISKLHSPSNPINP